MSVEHKIFTEKIKLNDSKIIKKSVQTAQIINISKDVMDILLTRKIAYYEEYNSYPACIDDHIYSHQGIRGICNILIDRLKSGKGYSIISIDDSELIDNHEMKNVFWNLFTCFARPLSQFSNGNMLHFVQKSEEAPPRRCSHSLSDNAAEIHTDGSYMYIEPPQFIGLICLSQAGFGGESILVDGRDILNKFKMEFPGNVKYLKQEYQFNTDKQLPDTMTLTKPIVVENGSTIIFNYNRIHIEAGHKATELSISHESKDSMDKLDTLLNREENQNVFKLRRGEMLVVNNHFMLHGRKPFDDNYTKDSKRLMIRLWGNER